MEHVPTCRSNSFSFTAFEVKFTPLVEEHLMNQVTDFSNRFSDVPSIPKYLLTPMDISLEDMMN